MRQPQKMFKHTQTIRRFLPTNCLSVFDHFVGLALKGLKGEFTSPFIGTQTHLKTTEATIRGVLENFEKFTRKQLCQSLFFDKVAGLRPEACNFIKKEPRHSCFPVNFAKFLRTLFLANTSERLILNPIKHLRLIILP